VPAHSAPKVATYFPLVEPARPNLTPEQQRCWNLAQVYARPPSTDRKAVASMVLGILSVLLLFIVTGIPAVVFGHLSLSKIRKSKGRLTGEGMAVSGLVLGYIGIAFSILVIPTIVIPNMRQVIAREKAGVNAMQMLISAQSKYSAKYPAQGYANSLVVLGHGDPLVDCGEPANHTFEHACLTGELTCTAGTWCTNGIYNFTLAGSCGGDGVCTDYVVMATPIATGNVTENYCSTAEAVIRSKPGPQLTTMVTLEECQLWPPVN